jgi:hypothetical protein
LFSGGQPGASMIMASTLAAVVLPLAPTAAQVAGTVVSSCPRPQRLLRDVTFLRAVG